MRTPFIFLVLLFAININAQLPDEAQITPDGRLVYGSTPVIGFYDINAVHKIEILLSEPDWFRLLDGEGGRNGAPGITLIGSIIIDDSIQLDSIEVSIKGQTSDSRNRSEKKSFSLKIDTYLDQDVMGYDNLNLNCAYEDESGMREVLYYDISRPFTTALKGNFVDLYINGQNWGPYNNIQQIEGKYIGEWFDDNDGTRWRAVAPDGVVLPGGPFGTGFSTLNYHGRDSTDYNNYYTLKKYSIEDPWQSLIDVCDNLNNVPLEDLYEALKYDFDIDRTLWYIAQEVIFSDDDSYIWKGGMDYYVYWDITTGRILPMEVDGNSVMNSRYLDWSPFFNEENPEFPIMNRLLQVPEVRQRYLAHIRKILKDHFVVSHISDRIDEFASILDQRVQDDPKALYTHTQFLAEVAALKSWTQQRHDFLSTHIEINKSGLPISNFELSRVGGGDLPPDPEEAVIANVTIGGSAQMVRLYYGQGIDGVFERAEMFDDGMHNDGTAGDGVFGASIPGHEANQYIRTYIEAIADDGNLTATYLPEGAEHDVYIYRVGQAKSGTSDVVINEFMASNDATVTDGEGNYEDWIELYNNGDRAVDLSDYTLSDDESNLTKWIFPDNTVIGPRGYLIIWADDDEEDTSQDEIHCSFKLSASGEVIVLTNADGEIIDQVKFDEQDADISLARHPNGVGDFSKGEHTHGEHNDELTVTNGILDRIGATVFPNPSDGGDINITYDATTLKNLQVEIVNAQGITVYMDEANTSNGSYTITSGILAGGVYMLKMRDQDSGEEGHIPLIVH